MLLRLLCYLSLLATFSCSSADANDQAGTAKESRIVLATARIAGGDTLTPVQKEEYTKKYMAVTQAVGRQFKLDLRAFKIPGVLYDDSIIVGRRESSVYLLKKHIRNFIRDVNKDGLLDGVVLFKATSGIMAMLETEAFDPHNVDFTGAVLYLGKRDGGLEPMRVLEFDPTFYLEPDSLTEAQTHYPYSSFIAPKGGGTFAGPVMGQDSTYFVTPTGERVVAKPVMEGGKWQMSIAKELDVSAQQARNDGAGQAKKALYLLHSRDWRFKVAMVNANRAEAIRSYKTLDEALEKRKKILKNWFSDDSICRLVLDPFWPSKHQPWREKRSLYYGLYREPLDEQVRKRSKQDSLDGFWVYSIFPSRVAERLNK